MTMTLRRAAATMAAAVCVYAAPLAQRGAPPPPPQQPAVFRSATQYVSMDVVVTDDRGEPVSSLTKDDFVITEDKRPQTIVDFSRVDVPINDRAVDLDAPIPPTPDVASNARSAATSRALVIAIDDMSVPPDMLVPLKRALTDFLKKLTPDDQVALIYVSRSDLSRDFTNDLGPLIEAANGRRGALGLQPMGRDPERELTTTLRNAMETLQAARQTRRAIILVGGRGCQPFNPADPMNVQFSNVECKDIIEMSRKTGVPIYGFDPRLFLDPGETNSSTLKALSASTNATASVGHSNAERAIDNILNQNGHYYLLGSCPAPVSTDGKFHKIEVTVKQAGLHVQAREGYTAPKPSSEVLTPKRAMTANLGAGLDDPGLPIRVFAAPLGPGAHGTRTAITVELTYPLPSGDQRALSDEIRFGAMALTPDAKIKASLQRPSTYTGTWTAGAKGRLLINDVIELPSEVLTLRVGVSSRALGKTGTTHLRIDVPDFGDKDLVMSPIVLGGPVSSVDAATGLDYLRGLVPFQPILNRQFAAADTLRVFARASFKPKSSITDVTVTSRIDGATTRRLPDMTLHSVVRKDGHADAVLDTPLSLNGLMPGSYQLVVTFTTPSKAPVTQRVPFDVR